MQQNTYDLLNKASEGDIYAKEKIVQDNMGLVYNVAKKFINRGVDLDDLVQIGAIGLVNAIDKFDTSYDVMFSTYAVPLIIGEIKRFLRDDGPIKVSRKYRIISAKAAAVRERLMIQNNKEPTVNEIAKELNIECEELIVSYEATLSPKSVYETVGDNEDVLLIDKISGGIQEENKIIDRITLFELINKLSERERKIIILRYFKDKKQSEIAKHLGISQVQVSRLEKQILIKMKEKIV